MSVERAVPLGLVILAVLYLVYAASIEHRVIGNLGQSGMTAQTVPYVLGAALLVCSVALTVQAFRRSPQTTEAAPNLLVWLSILLSVTYVLLLRPVGFVVSTAGFVYLLVYLGSVERLVPRVIPNALAGLAGVTVAAVALHRLVALVTSGMARAGRELDNALLANRLVGATVGLALTALVLFGLLALARRLPEKYLAKHVPLSLLVSLGTTVGLYLIFRQVFQVNLPTVELPF